MRRAKVIVTTKLKEKCFFYPYAFSSRSTGPCAVVVSVLTMYLPGTTQVVEVVPWDTTVHFVALRRSGGHGYLFTYWGTCDLGIGGDLVGVVLARFRPNRNSLLLACPGERLLLQTASCMFLQSCRILCKPSYPVWSSCIRPSYRKGRRKYSIRSLLPR